jgi:CheY-like chemotaxis protein
MSVLIVEDDPALERLLHTLMVRERLGVEVERRGDAALRAIQSGRYRAIVLDLMLPGMTGFDIVRRLARERPELLRRIIVITAVSQSQLRHFEHESAIWRLIRKPFDVSEFVQAVRECVRAHAPKRFEEIEALTRWLANRANACGARSALVVRNSGEELMLAASFGYADGVVEGYFPLPMSVNYPLAVAVRTRRPVWLGALTPPLPEYPLLLPLWTMNEAQSLAAVPLIDRESTVGAIGLSFGEAQRFDDEQRTMLVGMASECAEMLAKPST